MFFCTQLLPEQHSLVTAGCCTVFLRTVQASCDARQVDPCELVRVFGWEMNMGDNSPTHNMENIFTLFGVHAQASHTSNGDPVTGCMPCIVFTQGRQAFCTSVLSCISVGRAGTPVLGCFTWRGSGLGRRVSLRALKATAQRHSSINMILQDGRPT